LAGPLADEANRLRDAELSLLERDALLVPDNAGLLRPRAWLRHLQGWRKEAGQAFEAAHRLEPRAPQIMFNLAVYLNDSGRPREALPLAERLGALQPKRRGSEGPEAAL